MPSTYILRLTEGACSDLGISHPGPETSVELQPSLVQKFIDTFSDPAAIDSGVPFSGMPGRGLYRIRIEDWRGIVWVDRSAGVVWLCRAKRLADFPSETAAYAALAALGDDGLFPTQAEREKAAEAQVLAHALRAMRDAMQQAHELPHSWQDARVRRANQTLDEAEIIGRAYVERIEEEDEELIDRFLIAVMKPPTEFSVEDWVALMVARVFPSQHAEVLPIGLDDLPAGADFSPGQEIALAQQA